MDLTDEQFDYVLTFGTLKDLRELLLEYLYAGIYSERVSRINRILLADNQEDVCC